MESEGGTYSEQESHKSELRRPTFYFTIPQIPNTDITRLHEIFFFFSPFDFNTKWKKLKEYIEKNFTHNEIVFT